MSLLDAINAKLNPAPVVDWSIVGASKAKPADFDTRETLPDGTKRVKLENNLLKECDTLVLIDDSGSMAGASWNQVKKVLALLTDILIQNDPDGIDLYFLNHTSDEPANPENGRPSTGYIGIQNPDFILNKFHSIRPTNGTPTPQRLGLILDEYVKLCKLKAQMNDRPRPLNIIVWTDGVCPEEQLKSRIVGAARELDAINATSNQCGVQFFQIGNEPGVEEWLKRLDDNLQAEANIGRDMVDTKKFSDIVKAGGFTVENIVPLIIGALSKRHDKKAIA